MMRARPVEAICNVVDHLVRIPALTCSKSNQIAAGLVDCGLQAVLPSLSTGRPRINVYKLLKLLVFCSGGSRPWLLWRCAMFPQLMHRLIQVFDE
jgi:hypothetical protein